MEDDLTTSDLVETEWLERHLEDRRIVIIDARWRGDGTGRDLYLDGHIPGAVYVDWEQDLSFAREGIRYLILEPEEFADTMEKLGVSDRSFVIAYADQDYSGAARLWWALRYYGHERVAVLNGGMDRWVAQDRPLETRIKSPSRGSFIPDRQPSLLARSEDIWAAIQDPVGKIKLVDTRPIEQFSGSAVWTPSGSRYLPAGQNRIPIGDHEMRAGHLPGAIHLLSSGNLDPQTWEYLDLELLKQRAAAAGLGTEDRIITYCGCGISASLGLFALHLAGYRNLALYDGSWEEWGTDPSHPIEKD